MSVEEIAERYGQELEQELRSIVENSVATSSAHVEPLYGMLRYHLGWADETQQPALSRSGKRIRPVLCLLSCEANGGDYHRALSTAASIELVHNFTLIHDDIQDQSTQRRHRPTVWALWGEAQAINAGDALYAISSLGLLRSSAHSVPPRMTLTAAQMLHSTLLSVCEGQYLDLAFERRNDVNPRMYLTMIARKTADLIGCSAQLGAYLATEDVDLASRYRDFGRALGMAFQIQDDILGIWGETTATGKPVGDDIYHSKKTLPILHALEVAGPEEKLCLEAIFAKDEISVEEVELATQTVSQLGAREHAERQARKWFDQAIETLDKANPKEPAGGHLREMAASLIGRAS